MHKKIQQVCISYEANTYLLNDKRMKHTYLHVNDMPFQRKYLYIF